MDRSIAFIGAGNMGGAIALAACKAIPPTQVHIYNPTAAKSAVLAARCGCTVAPDATSAVSACHFTVLGIKPQITPQVLRGLLPALKNRVDAGLPTVLVSIVAGVLIADLATILAEADLTLPIVRVIPNTPAAVGEGLLLMTPSAAVSDDDYAALQEILAPAGMLETVPEPILAQAMAVYSCSPAFVYMFIEAMADGAVQAGLPRDMAQRYAAQAVRGAAAMVLESGQHPGALKDAVCSPGGYTIRGVAELEKHGFRAAAAQAVLIAGGAKL